MILTTRKVAFSGIVLVALLAGSASLTGLPTPSSPSAGPADILIFALPNNQCFVYPDSPLEVSRIPDSTLPHAIAWRAFSNPAGTFTVTFATPFLTDPTSGQLIPSLSLTSQQQPKVTYVSPGATAFQDYSYSITVNGNPCKQISPSPIGVHVSK